MKENGFYIIKDKFFDDMKDVYLKGNKKGNRPHYYCFKDTEKGIYWVIPMSSRVEKYKKIIKSKEERGKSCDILHIAKLDNNKESVFLIQDMFPVIDEYIEREYTICGNHLRITSENLSKEIDKKAKKIFNLLKKGIRFMPTQPDVMLIYKNLINRFFVK